MTETKCDLAIKDPSQTKRGPTLRGRLIEDKKGQILIFPEGFELAGSKVIIKKFGRKLLIKRPKDESAGKPE